MAKGSIVRRLAAPIVSRTAPGMTAGFVRQAFDRAVDGAGPLKGAAASADARLRDNDGDVEKAVRGLIDSHVKLAGLQGFITNLGGLVTMAVAIPANISGLALLQAHLIAGIAHLRGYDLADPRVRNAVIACMLGDDAVKSLVKKKKLPSRPMAIATAPQHDPQLDEQVAAAVTTELIAQVAGKRTIAFVGRRLPVLGGGVGAVSDGYSTYRIGQYAARELRPRNASA